MDIRGRMQKSLGNGNGTKRGEGGRKKRSNGNVWKGKNCFAKKTFKKFINENNKNIAFFKFWKKCYYSEFINKHY